MASKRVASSADWAFRSRETNKITIVQWPNIPLAIFLASIPIGWTLTRHSAAAKAVDVIGTAGLGWWAIDEVLRGVNPWRRALGIVGCAFAVSRVLALLR